MIPFQRATIRCFVLKILTARYRANECPCLEEGIFLKLLEYIYDVKTVNNFALRFSQGYCILSLGCLMPNDKALFDLYFWRIRVVSPKPPFYLLGIHAKYHHLHPFDCQNSPFYMMIQYNRYQDVYSTLTERP